MGSMNFINFLNSCHEKNIVFSLQEDQLKVKAPNNTLSPEVIEQLKQYKPDLIDWLKTRADKKNITQNSQEVIDIVDRNQVLPVSFGQEQLWLIDKLEDVGDGYHFSRTLNFSGDLDTEALITSFSQIFSRHEALRTVFIENDGVLQQRILDVPENVISVNDISHVDKTLQLEECERITEDFCIKAFDLEKDYMMRLLLIKLDDEQHRLVVVLHHIASDGWSLGVLVKEFQLLYSSFVKQAPNVLPDLPVQYVDFSQWQRKTLTGDAYDSSLKYWINELDGAPEVHSLPTDRSRPVQASFKGSNFVSNINTEVLKSIKSLAQSSGTTLYTVLEGLFAILITRYSESNDIVIGSPVANRAHKDVEGLIGYFVNMIALRHQIDPMQTLTQFIEKNKKAVLSGFSHETIPFEHVVKNVVENRNTSNNPLVQISFVLQNNDVPEFDLPGLKCSIGKVQHQNTSMDLQLEITESSSGLALSWTYATDLFDAETIARLAESFEVIIKSAVENPESKLCQLKVLSQSDQYRQLNTWNNTSSEFDSRLCIPDLIEQQVEKTPNDIAIVCGEDSITYAELNAKANQLAQFLIQERKVHPDLLVGICLERSLNLAVAILAVLKSGAAYVPIDPNYPQDRIEYMLLDADLKTILTQKSLSEKLDFNVDLAVNLDCELTVTRLQNFSADNTNHHRSILQPHHLAYVIYTSGSTGKPKGVMIEHRNAVALLHWGRQVFTQQQLNNVLISTSVCFDLFVFELFTPMVSGGKGTLVSNILDLAGDNFSQEISLINTVPSAIKQLLALDAIPTTVNTVNLAGEALDQKLVDAIYATGVENVFDLYGPSEDTTYSTYTRRLPGGVNNIGKPILNTRAYILDEFGNVVPQGAVGELYLAGDGLSRGYLNQPALTEEKFVEGTVCLVRTERLYRTNDLVRWLPDGNLEYLGRMDHQVKIRGFRIELGEIEAVLTKHKDVDDVVVVAKSNGEGDARLVAYLTSHNNADWSSENEVTIEAKRDLIDCLRRHLSESVPEFMIPSVFMILNALPLTPNGKVDRKALPEPDFTQLQTDFVEPKTQTEALLVGIWQEVLAVEKVSTTANFFELGGHSLLVIQVSAKLREHAIHLEASKIFSSPVLVDLAKEIDRLADQAEIHAPEKVFSVPPKGIPENCENIAPDMLSLVDIDQQEIEHVVSQIPGGASNIEDIYPLAPLQEGILFHHTLGDGEDPYVMPVLFRIKGRATLEAFQSALQKVIDRHDTLRTLFLWDRLSNPLQIVCREANLPIGKIDLDPAIDPLEQMNAYCTAENLKMNLSKAPLIEMVEAKEHSESDINDSYLILLKLHHIVIDHVSSELIQKELSLFMAGKETLLSPVKPYRNFVAHSRYHNEESRAESYFKQLLGNISEPTAPFDLHHIKEEGEGIVETKHTLSNTLANQIREASRKYQLSPGVLFHLAWAMVVSQCSARKEVVFGSVFSGRLQGLEGAEEIMGMFINTLPLRIDLENKSIYEAVKDVQQNLHGLLEHEQAPLSLVQRCSDLPSGASLFSAILNYRHSKPVVLAKTSDEKGRSDIEVLTAKERTNYPFTFIVDDFGDDFSIEAHIDASVSADRILGYMEKAITKIATLLIENPDEKVLDVSVLSEQEENTLIREWNDNATSYEKTRCIQERFENQVSLNGDRVALISENSQLSYDELNRRANQLAHYLQKEANVKPDTLIGICLERSVDMIVSILAILKAGGAYVPLDPAYPEQRLHYMMSDAKLRTIISNTSLQKILPDNDATILCLDDASTIASIDQCSEVNIPCRELGSSERSLAYVNYTSGSTGNPKGVLIEHQSVVSLVENNHYVELNSDTIMMQAAPAAFDAATFEIWGALLNGGCLAIQHETPISMEGLSEFLKAKKINTAWMTSGLFDQYVESQLQYLPCLKNLLVGGDVVNPQTVKRIRDKNPQLQLINGYGPTENTTFSCCYTIPADNDAHAAIPIGKPLANRQAFVLDENLKPAPVGVAGELYVAGPGVARGYLNRDTLSQEKFVTNPYCDQSKNFSSERMYRTGDLVRWREDGNIEFVGRVDNQVKIRGFRIEPGEIEIALTAKENIQDAVVVAKNSLNGEKRLVAYIVAKEKDSSEPHSLSERERKRELIENTKAVLGEEMPSYMVPAIFVVMDSLPLTANGKVDRKALPEPDMSELQSQYVAPKTVVETGVCELCQEILGVEKVGLTDNFFQLGGHSLSATRLVANINKRFQSSIQLVDVFSCQAIKDIADLVSDRENIEVLPHILPVPRDAELQTSYAQQRLWLMDRIEGGSGHYNISGALDLIGHIDEVAANKAFLSIVKRHESLRTRFAASESGEPVQVIEGISTFDLQVEDLSGLDKLQAASKIAELTQQEAEKEFDIEKDFMLRAKLIKLDTHHSRLLVTMHHIAADGWSLAILIREFSHLYQSAVEGKSHGLAPLTVQYADYAQWQRAFLQGEVLEKKLQYWEDCLAGLPVIHSLPLDKPRPLQQSFSGRSYSTTVSSELCQSLNTLCDENGATLFMGLHAAFSALISRYSNESDIVIGTPIANREQTEISELIGFFVNNLVLRSDLSGTPAFSDLILQSKNTLLEAYQNQQVPFDQVVERLQPERSLSHSPLFQVMMILQNNETSDLELPDLSISVVEPENRVAKYDLTLTITENQNGLHLDWEYNTDLFLESTIAKMANHFVNLLAALIQSPTENVFKLGLLEKSEIKQQLIDWNNTDATYQRDKCFHELFEEQAQQTPNRIAVACGDEQLTYAELNRRSNQLASYLRTEKGVQPDDLIGLCIQRSLNMMISLLGILKAGGAYVPMDPEYPEARLRYMLEDANLSTVLTETSLLSRTPVTEQQAVCLDDPNTRDEINRASDCSISTAELGLSPGHLAYVIYTSGSTGNPKGVMVEHGNLLNFLQSMRKEPGVNQEDCLLAVTSTSFDIHTLELFTPLLTGAKLLVAKKDETIDAMAIKRLIENHDVSIMQATPATWKMLIDADWNPAHAIKVLCGGEALSMTLAKALLQRANIELWNMYGPTETTVWSTCKNILPTDPAIYMGKPIDNTQVYVLSPENGQLAPAGVSGELVIAGEGVTRGYRNRQDLTDKAFIPNPYFEKGNPSSSELLYKTGDLVRWLPDGELEYLSRIDNQVKIHGFRIELGEVEHVLLRTDTVKDAVVMAKTSETGDKRLVAYLIAEDNVKENNAKKEKLTSEETFEGWFIENIRESIASDLPEYMVPTAFVVLEAFPLTPNGKVDRKSLPRPDFTKLQASYQASETELEILISDIWQEVLNISQVGVTDNFFHLGGHSLMVMQVISRLAEKGIVMEARQLFATPILRELANALENTSHGVVEQVIVPENLIPNDCQKLTPDMLPLVSLTEKDIERIIECVPGGVSNIQDIYPLAPLQEGILFHHMTCESSDPYVTPVMFAFSDQSRVNDFVEALQHIIERHDVLRTGVFWDELSQPVQVVCRSAKLALHKVKKIPNVSVKTQMEVLCEPENQWIELGTAPLMELHVSEEKEVGTQYAVLKFHHIISDHVGLDIIQSEINAIYNDCLNELPTPAPYRNFVANAVDSSRQEKAEKYFKSLLKDVDETCAPFGLVDTQGDGNRIVEGSERLSSDFSEKLREVAKRHSCSPATLFHTAWALVVSACSARNDIVFGTVMSGRSQNIPGIDTAMGVFINTLPLRINTKEANVSNIVKDIQASLVDLLEYEQTPLVLAQRCSGLTNGAPLFSSVLNYRHSQIDDHVLATTENKMGVAVEKVHERTNFPIGLSVDDLGKDFQLSVQVDASLKSKSILGYMKEALSQLVNALVHSPDSHFNQLPILPESEYQQLEQWNNTQTEYESNTCIHKVFERQVTNNPNAIALVFDNQKVTYRELDERANQLANYLVTERGVTPDSLVGVCLDRSVALVESILAIVKAGGAYVPLDPSYPESRLTYMLNDAIPATVITTCAIQEKTPIFTQNALLIDDTLVKKQISSESVSPVENSELTSNHLAYVIYTSGSTGKPKGVMIEHHSLVNLVSFDKSLFGLEEGSKLLNPLSIGFDAGNGYFWDALCSGASLYMEPTGGDLFSYIEEHTITHAVMPAALLNVQAVKSVESLRVLISGGDACNPDVLQKLNDKTEFINVYGPTENTVTSTYHKLVGNETTVIGKPLQNVECFVLSPTKMPLPENCVGELYLGGAGLARGYLNDLERTQEKFIENPFYSNKGDQQGVGVSSQSERLYRTGDLVRRLPDGSLEFIGRTDNQVKIRGYRIELGEIESKLMSHPSVKESAILVKNLASGEKSLVAYVATHDGLDSNSASSTEVCDARMTELRAFLSESLPEYMVPSVISLMAALPLTGNGKVDRKYLTSLEVVIQQAELVLPETETEKMLCQIWSDILGVEQIGICDNFFHLGGDSLLSVRILAKIKTEFELDIPVKTILANPTIESIATHIDVIKMNKENSLAEESEMVEEGFI